MVSSPGPIGSTIGSSGDEIRIYRFLALIFVAGAIGSPLSSLLPVFVDAVLHHPPSYTAGLRSLQLAVTGVFAIVGGVLADRIGQKRALVLSLVGIALTSLIFAMKDDVALIALVAVLGITTSLQTVSGQSYIVASSTRSKLGSMTAFYYLGNTLGGALGNAVAGTVAERLGFSAVAFGGFGLSLVLIFAAIWQLPDIPRPARDRTPGVVQLFGDYVQLVRQRRIARVGVLRFLPTSLYGMAGLLAPLLIYRMSGSVATAGFYATTSLLVATATQLAVGRLIDRHGPALPTQILLVVVVAVTAVAAMSTSSLPLFFGCGVVLTAALWGLSTTIPSLIHEACGPAERGRALGLVHFLWSVAMLFGTAVGGILVGINSSLPFAAFALLNVAAIVIALTLGRRPLEVQEGALSVRS